MLTSQTSARRAGYDVVVAGAGVIGLAVGWRASQRGLRVLVLDAGRPGGGATRAAAGMLAPVTEASFGEEDLLALNLEAARRYPDFVSSLEDEAGMGTGYRPSGTLAVALDRDDAELLERLHAFQLSLGLETEWLTGRACRRLEPGLAPRVVGGIRSALDHQVDPRSLTAALTRALERRRGELRAGTAVDEICASSGQVNGVVLGTGERIAAELVVVAAGWRSGEIRGLSVGGRLPLRPVKGQILRLRGRPELPMAERVVRTTDLYMVPRADGELVVGATVEERGPDTSVTAGGVLELLRRAYEALPGIAELELVEAAAGLRPAAPDNKPVVGAGQPAGVVWATGHWRHGILLAPITADAVLDVLAGDGLPELFAPFSPERFASERALVADSR